MAILFKLQFTNSRKLQTTNCFRLAPGRVIELELKKNRKNGRRDKTEKRI